MNQYQFVQVLLPIPLPQAFSYEVPYELRGKICFGQRVLVQFGPRKIVSALVWNLTNEEPDHELKSLVGILDEKPIINQKQKELWEWMADYYLCSLGEVMKAALPAGLKLESHTRILVIEDFEWPNPMSELEELAWLFLLKNPGASIQDLGDVLKRKNPLPVIHQLVQKGAVQLEEKLVSHYSRKTAAFIRLDSQYAEENELSQLFQTLNKAPKQREVMESYFLELENIPNSKGLASIPQKVLLKENASRRTAIDSLVKKGVFIRSQEAISRLEHQVPGTEKPKKLNAEQKEALRAIKHSPENSVTLLHGITSSGKTEVYIHLIQDALKAGKQVLYLLPEIALTEQMINRLRKVFGNSVGVFHSKYSDSERVELWQDVLSASNGFKLILGARSALFLPFTNLGLIIVDEEHETSFKQQDPAPRYHARDAAIVLGNICQARVVLGTATPSLETYFNARSGKYQLVLLKQRHLEIPLPEIILANSKEAHKKKRIKGHFTPELLEAIDQALVNKEQVILFQNRRGFSPYIECHSCGHVPKCRDCDVSLTLHKFRSKLVCHYCGYSIPIPHQCPNCSNNALQTKGLGTEGLEDEMGILFPYAKIARLDLDAARSRKSYSKILDDFEKGKTNVLIGTQMISKGLDFSHVSVVGIVNADNLLHFPDFRSFERAFQLMTQVSGRAGRSGSQGLVVIQSFNPEHRVIQQVLRNDFQSLYQNELKERLEFSYPPYTRIIRLTFKHKDQDLVNRSAHAFAQSLRKKWTTRIMGPQAPGISRVQQMHLRQILIKSAKGLEHKQIRQDIRHLIQKMNTDKTFRAVIIQPDVDPV